ncbi:hypothetical protein DAMA08_013420 [Martiniozyma asiatica (nom. inval.)]|nr:hypothetical protein DAMA08_013420 [Martiniozyma asiatica]
MDAVAELFSFPIDFQGQSTVYKFNILLATAASIVSFVFCFAVRDITLLPFCFGAFLLLAAIVILPPYSAYKTSPVTYLKRPQAKVVEIEL